jgi:hypothetical protein
MKQEELHLVIEGVTKVGWPLWLVEREIKGYMEDSHVIDSLTWLSVEDMTKIVLNLFRGAFKGKCGMCNRQIPLDQLSSFTSGSLERRRRRFRCHQCLGRVTSIQFGDDFSDQR